MTLVFNYGTQSVTVTNYGDTDKPMFKGKDIATFLGYKNTTKAIRDHVWTKNKTNFDQIIGGNDSFPPSKLDSQTILINEAGLYQLIFASKMPYAEVFQEWVFNTVLPSIRKTNQFKVHHKPIRKIKTFSIQTEADLHKKVIQFCRENYPSMVTTVCNPELSNDTQQKRIECAQLGYIAGTYDLLIMHITNKHSGFAIEFKSPKGSGTISQPQIDMRMRYEASGMKVLISNDYDQIVLAIVEYMRNVRYSCGHCEGKFKSIVSLGNHHKYFHRIN